MAFWKLFILALAICFLGILQNSFLPHLGMGQAAPNLIFLLFFCVAFFEKSGEYQAGIFCAMAGGLVLDVFSSSYFGPAIVSLLLAYFFIKAALYFLKEIQGGALFLAFIIIFTAALVIYSTLFYCLVNIPHISLAITGTFLGFLAYNVICACLAFCISLLVNKNNVPQRQLKLFQ